MRFLALGLFIVGFAVFVAAKSSWNPRVQTLGFLLSLVLAGCGWLVLLTWGMGHR